MKGKAFVCFKLRIHFIISFNMDAHTKHENIANDICSSRPFHCSIGQELERLLYAGKIYFSKFHCACSRKFNHRQSKGVDIKISLNIQAAHQQLLNVYYTYIRRRIRLLDGRVLLGYLSFKLVLKYIT